MPNLIEIVADHLGTNPKRNGNVFRFGCPSCKEGKDRFVVWPPGFDKPCGTFFCRRCRVAGDGIEYCKRFLGLTYPQACNLLGTEKKSLSYSRLSFPPSIPASFPIVSVPVQQWQEQAKRHIEAYHQNLKTSLRGQTLLKERGISLQTAERFSIGYNAIDTWQDRESWGLPLEVKENGKDRRIWLPNGLVIPRFDNGSGRLIGLKIRRERWKEGDSLGKYVEIVGSANKMGIYGNASRKVAVVLESELDAMIVQQEADDLCFCVALGGAGSKKLDKLTHELLVSTKLLLVSSDRDDAGMKELIWWKKILPKSIPWRTPFCKSPGDAFLMGLNLHQWIENAITTT